MSHQINITSLQTKIAASHLKIIFVLLQINTKIILTLSQSHKIAGQSRHGVIKIHQDQSPGVWEEKTAIKLLYKIKDNLNLTIKNNHIRTLTQNEHFVRTCI